MFVIFNKTLANWLQNKKKISTLAFLLAEIIKKEVVSGLMEHPVHQALQYNKFQPLSY